MVTIISDMFRLKRDGNLATLKLLNEEDEEQDHDPPRQIGVSQITKFINVLVLIILIILLQSFYF